MLLVLFFKKYEFKERKKNNLYIYILTINYSIRNILKITQIAYTSIYLNFYKNYNYKYIPLNGLIIYIYKQTPRIIF